MTKDEMKNKSIVAQSLLISIGFSNPSVSNISVIKALYLFFSPLEKRIAELEKENAQLKSKNCWKACEYVEPKSQWICQHIQDVVQLTKAKELIKEMLSILPKNNSQGLWLYRRSLAILKEN